MVEFGGGGLRGGGVMHCLIALIWTGLACGFLGYLWGAFKWHKMQWVKKVKSSPLYKIYCDRSEETGVSVDKIISGNCSREDWEKLRDAAENYKRKEGEL